MVSMKPAGLEGSSVGATTKKARYRKSKWFRKGGAADTSAFATSISKRSGLVPDLARASALDMDMDPEAEDKTDKQS